MEDEEEQMSQRFNPVERYMCLVEATVIPEYSVLHRLAAHVNLRGGTDGRRKGRARDKVYTSGDHENLALCV